MSNGFRFTGQQKVSAKLKSVAKTMPDRIKAALYQEAQIDMTEVKKRTPVDTGNLRASEHVTKPSEEGSLIFVEMVAGGVAAPYAITVHENLDAFHPVGQAKYMESVIMESAPYIAERVRRRLELKD